MSDSHGGHKLGLLNPATEIENEHGSYDYPELNEAQKYLWDDVYIPGVKETKKLAGTDEIVLIHLGDMTQGNKYPSEQLDTRMSDQIVIAYHNMLPWFKYRNVQKLRVVRGTASHSFGEGSSEILSTKILKERYKKRDIRTLYHGMCNILGLSVDYAHHGPGQSSRKWLEGNTARYYLRDAMYKEILAGRVPPKLYLRGHYHTFIQEWLRIDGENVKYDSTLMVMPSLALAGDWVRQALRSIYQITNGIVAVEIINGQIHQTHEFTQTIDIRTKEKLL